MPLFLGDPAPHFAVPSSVNPDYHFDSAAGRYIVLSFFGSSAIPFSNRLLQEVERRHERFDVTNLVFFGVSIDGNDRNRLKQQFGGIMYFWDVKRSVSELYGLIRPKKGDGQEPVPPNDDRLQEEALANAAAESKPAEDASQYVPCTFVLDHGLRIVAMLPFAGEPEAHLDEVLRAVDSLPPIDSIAIPAPVVTIPYVFERELCRELIDYYVAHGGEDSGFMRDVGGKTVPILDYSHKRRMDCEITDEGLIRATQQRLHRRVVPAIRQAFQFNATRIERHIVACYDASDGGHFRAHRDNTTLGTAHRRFAVTLNLNAEEFEGGELRFPEFGPHRYTATTGGAIVFSCSLLHEATPVTKGRRYAFLPFLYDDAAAVIRQRNRQFLAGGSARPANEAANQP